MELIYTVGRVVEDRIVINQFLFIAFGILLVWLLVLLAWWCGWWCVCGVLCGCGGWCVVFMCWCVCECDNFSTTEFLYDLLFADKSLNKADVGIPSIR
jgi:hypothetical protein